MEYALAVLECEVEFGLELVDEGVGYELVPVVPEGVGEVDWLDCVGPAVA